MALAVPAYADRRSAGALLTSRDRAGALVAVAMIHVGFVALLLTLQTHPEMISELTEKLTVIDIAPPPEPPPPPPPPPREVSLDAAPRPEPNVPAPARMPDIASPAPVQPPIVFPPTVPVPPGEASSGSGSTGQGEASRGEGGGNGTGGTGSGGGAAGSSPLPAANGPVSGRWIPRQPGPISVRKSGDGAARNGWATLMCRTAERDRLTDCIPRQESHAGFAAALLEAVPRLRYRATDSKGGRVIGMNVQVYMPVRERR